MSVREPDTIVAQVTPPGYGGVGIVRVSGPKTAAIAQAILHVIPQPRHAEFTNFYSTDNEVIDQGIAIYFTAPNSFTGEEVLELQGHGGPVVMDSLLRAILSLGTRLANPGEFSERAFLNGRVDLVQAEAVMDLINASSVQAAHSALLSLQGEFSARLKILSAELMDLRVHVEAGIDFGDEDIELISKAAVTKKISTLLPQLQDLINNATQGSLLREGIKVVIVGEPNVGKSSLLNYFAGRDAAIVTNIPGTTRDVIREFINLDGLPLHIIDTAGLRETAEQIEQEGIKRTWREIELADFILLMTDRDEVDLEKYKNFAQKLLIIRNKIDISPLDIAGRDDWLYISVKTGAGIDQLRKILKERAGFNQTTEGIFIARRRHLEALQRAVNCLGNIRLQQPELVAEELRLAQNALGEITGEVYTDDLLGKIFSEFCVGK